MLLINIQYSSFLLIIISTRGQWTLDIHTNLGSERRYQVLSHHGGGYTLAAALLQYGGESR